ncbi:MAG: WXG100 family type VII secretion target, partial [Thermoflexales bacterium]
MPGDKVRADYDELARTASLWQRESESNGQMLAALRREMAVLEKGDWIGPGATAFYAEMNSAVLPAVRRLASALSEAGQVSRRISTIVKTAEDDAARVLRGNAADVKLPAMGVSKDQVQPSGSNAGAAAGGILGAILGGPLGAILGAGLGSKFDSGPDTGGSFVKLSDAPKTVEVPKVLNDGLADAWKDSFPKGRSQEQGGMLVQKGDGTLEFRRGAAGDSGSFSPNYGDLKDGETLIGLVHTHPYDATEGGHTNVSFSGADI